MADGPDGSIPARAITFARQGCVAFTYDMVGYNDTRQIPTAPHVCCRPAITGSGASR